MFAIICAMLHSHTHRKFSELRRDVERILVYWETCTCLTMVNLLFIMNNWGNYIKSQAYRTSLMPAVAPKYSGVEDLFLDGIFVIALAKSTLRDCPAPFVLFINDDIPGIRIIIIIIIRRRRRRRRRRRNGKNSYIFFSYFAVSCHNKCSSENQSTLTHFFHANPSTYLLLISIPDVIYLFISSLFSVPLCIISSFLSVKVSPISLSQSFLLTMPPPLLLFFYSSAQQSTLSSLISPLSVHPSTFVSICSSTHHSSDSEWMEIEVLVPHHN